MQKKGKFQFDTTSIVKAAVLAAISIILTRVFSIMVPLGGLPALRLGFGSIPLMISGMLFGPVIGGLTGVVADLIGVMLNSMGGSFFPGFTLSAAMNGIIPGILFYRLKIHKREMNFNIINLLVTLVFLIGIIWLSFTSGMVSIADGKPVFSDTRALLLVIGIVLISIVFLILPFVIQRNSTDTKAVYGYDKIAFAVTMDYLIVSLTMNTTWLSIMFNSAFMVFLPGRIVAAVVSIPIYTFIIVTLARVLRLEDHVRK